MHYLIKDLNQNEKPREKLLRYGAANLTDIELLALILRSGGKENSVIDVSRSILDKYHKLSELVNVDLQQLIQIKFVDIAKASAIIAAIEIGIRIASEKNLDNLDSVTQPEDVYKIMRKDLFGKIKEHIYLISLNSRNKIIAKDLISVGTINETMLSPRELLRQALLRNAVAVILVHNHPSNDPTPSEEDIVTTKNIAGLFSTAGVPLLDHIIMTDKSYASMKTAGFLSIK